MSIVSKPAVLGHVGRRRRGRRRPGCDLVAVGDLRERAAAAQQRLAAVAVAAVRVAAAQDRVGALAQVGVDLVAAVALDGGEQQGAGEQPADADRGDRGERDPRAQAAGQPHGRSAQPTPRTVWRIRGSPAALELAAQVADEDVDHVGLDVGRVAPHEREQLVAREHLAGVADEHVEQVELAPGEAELAAVAGGDVAARVDDDVARDVRAGALGAVAAQQRLEPRGQLGDRERLDQVVVGAGLQAGDAVLDLVARGQHADGRCRRRRRAGA